MKYDMYGKQTRAVAWRCEESRGKRWTARICRELIPLFGKSASCKQHLCSKMRERLEQHRLNCPGPRPIESRKRVELVPRVDENRSALRLTNTGTNPGRDRVDVNPVRDATTQVRDARNNKQPDAVRINSSTRSMRCYADTPAQAMDGQFASVYRVNHCKMVPTSPAPMTSEFPPQRPDVAYGCDNFQVGGTGSGETQSHPMKTNNYRGGMNWCNREVYTPRPSRCSDRFARSLRKYPSSITPVSSEVLERLVTYNVGSPYSPLSPRRSPKRDTHSHREWTHDAHCSPRAPEEHPTRDRRDEYREAAKQAYLKQGDARYIREMTRKVWRSLRKMSTYPPNAQAYLDGSDPEYYDTPIRETSETEHELDRCRDTSPQPVNIQVQAVAATSSLGVETKLISRTRTIAIPLTPSDSTGLPARAFKQPDVTKSVQTFKHPITMDTDTSTTELSEHETRIVYKKSKSLSDFRLNRNFKTEILAWLDDTIDPKIKALQEVVLNNLDNRLKGVYTGSEKIQVKIGNCLKSHNKLVTTGTSACEIRKEKTITKTIETQVSETTVESTDRDEFEVVINEWLGNISIRKDDVLSKPLKKEHICKTFVRRLKDVVVGSCLCRNQSLRGEILEILNEVPIEVNDSDKSARLTTLTDDLISRLNNVLQDKTNTETFDVQLSKQPEKVQDLRINDVFDVSKKQSVTNTGAVIDTTVDLVDFLIDSINSNLELEDAVSKFQNTELSKTAALQYASQLSKNIKVIDSQTLAKAMTSQPVTVFMVQNLSRNYITRASGANLSQQSKGAITDKDSEASIKEYKLQIIQRIDLWLSNLAVLRGNNTNFRHKAIQDLASDIVDRHAYLELNKSKSSDTDELEHLKYLIFKWMKKYVGEEDMDMLNHAEELMKMTRNIPVPKLNRSEDLLCKSNSESSDKSGNFKPGTSNDLDKDNLCCSKSDSGLVNQMESENALTSRHFAFVNVSINENTESTKKDRPKSALENRMNSKPSLKSCASLHNVIDSLGGNEKKHKNSFINSIPKLAIRRSGDLSVKDSANVRIINQNNRNQYRNSSNYQENRNKLDLTNKAKIKRDTFNSEQGRTLRSKSCTSYRRDGGNNNTISNYILHKMLKNKNKTKQKESCTSKRNSKVNPDDVSFFSMDSTANHIRDGANLIPVQNENARSPECCGSANQEPGSSRFMTPMSANSGKPSSAAAQLMANWRAPSAFTPPSTNRPMASQVHDEFNEYLRNWCQEIPIPANTPEETQVAEQSRAGILNGIWKIITKLRAQPAVFQNKFYYEDVLGKEIDGLIDCLPQTQELKEKRHDLKSQLLEKNAEMNELMKDIEMPDNFKELAERKAKQMKERKLREVCNLDHYGATKIYEMLLKYCCVDDFLNLINYTETNKFLAKAYKNKLLKLTQSYFDEQKRTHGKEMEELQDVFDHEDVMNVLRNVPIPTENSMKEDKDEVLLALEIEEWMMGLPLAKNDDGIEQQLRRIMRDELVKKIHNLEKRGNCCDDSQLKHDVSQFLDIVPLERDQDLKINEMVDALANRLKNRRGCGSGGRKKVAFQDRSEYEANYSNRLLHSSQLSNVQASNRIIHTNDEWTLGDDEDAQYRAFSRNIPLSSSIVEQPPDEWELATGQDAQYKALFRERPACSSMIEPQFDYGPEDPGHNLVPIDVVLPSGQTSYLAYSPGQFQESARGGSLGGFLRDSPQPVEDYRYHPRVNARRGTPPPMTFEEDSYLMPNGSMPIQFHSFPSNQTPGMMQHFDQPQGIQWVGPAGPNEASSFVSLEDADSRRDPPMAPIVPTTGRRCSNAPPEYESHRSQIEPNKSHVVPSQRSKLEISQGYRGPVVSLASPGYSSNQRFQVSSSNLVCSPDQPCMGSAQRDPNMFEASREYSPAIQRVDPAVSEVSPEYMPSQRFQIPSAAQLSSLNQSAPEYRLPHCTPVSSQGTTNIHPCGGPVQQDRFIPDERFSRQSANVSSFNRDETDYSLLQPNQPVEVSVQVHRAPQTQSGFVSIVSQQRQAVGQGAARNRSDPRAPAPPEFRRSTDREGIQDIINQNVPRHQNVQELQLPTRPASQAPSSIHNRQFLSTSAPLPENRPNHFFYSTPNSRANPPPPNIRERRQVEKEGPARRIDMGTGPDEEDRCRCRERYKRRRRLSCDTCDNCLDSLAGGGQGYLSYPYPFPYPYMPMGAIGRPPQYPPYCRR